MNEFLKMPDVFSNNMVLQRNEKIKLWGSCRKNAKVDICFNGKKYSVIGENDKFYIELAPEIDGKGLELSVQSEKEEIIFTNVAVGEVWIVSGQSNVVMPLMCTKDGLLNANFISNNDVRYYKVPKKRYESIDDWNWSFYPEKPKNEPWKKLTPQNSGAFSAVAFYFAKKLNDELNIPIGIIDCSYNGTNIFTWISKERLLSNEITAPYTLQNLKYIDTKDEEKYRIEDVKFQSEINFICENYKAGDNVIFPAIAMGKNSPNRHGGLYETMYKTIVPYTVKGILWYQGESNAGGKNAADVYMEAFKLLAKQWRDELKNEQLPIISIQIAGCGSEYIGGITGTNWAYMREVQQRLSEIVTNNYLVSCADCGEVNDLHPFEKRTISERAACVALFECYGFHINANFPTFKCANIVDNKVEINFNYTYGKLIGANRPIEGFEVRIDDNWEKVIATVSNDKIIIEENRAEAVRHNFCNYPNICVYNCCGLPVLPFGERMIENV